MIEHHVTVSVDGDRIKATDVRTRGEAIEFITNAIDSLAPDIDGISFYVEKKTAEQFAHAENCYHADCDEDDFEVHGCDRACPEGCGGRPPVALTNLEDIYGPSARLGDWRNDG